MMEYGLVNNSLSSLAYEPFCFDKEDLFNQAYTYTQVLNNFNFNGVNDDILASVGTATNISNEKSVFGDFDVDGFINKSYSLDYILHSETALKEGSDDTVSNDCGISTPLGSPGSSICSVDSLSYEIIETINTDEGNWSKMDLSATNGMENVHFSHGDKADNINLNMLSSDNVPASNTDQSVLAGHMYTNASFSGTEVSCYDTLSPQSIDSAILSLCDDNDDAPQAFIAKEWQNRTQDNDTSVLGCARSLVDTDVTSVFDLLRASSTDSGMSSLEEISDLGDDLIWEDCETQKECESNEMHRSVSLLEVPQYKSSAIEYVDFNINNESGNTTDFSSYFPAETESVSCTERNLPYKRKKKTPEQKLRKKEHNRKSAARYRVKKKEHSSTVFSEVDVLEKRNIELKSNVEDLRKEIDYLKSLMLDVIKARLSKQKKVGLEHVLTGLMK